MIAEPLVVPTESTPEVVPVRVYPWAAPRHKTIRDVLLAAALYIEEHGWTQYTVEDGAGHVCAVGALLKVSGADPILFRDSRFYIEKFLIDEANGERTPFDRFTGRGKPNFLTVDVWNDAPRRVQGEVTAALRRAADKAKP